MFSELNTGVWMNLSTEDRQLLAEQFNITKTKGLVVVDGEVKDDGYENTELKKVTRETLQEFTGSKEDDMLELIKLTLEKLHGTKEEETTEEQSTDSGGDETKTKRRKASSRSKKSE